MSTKRGVSKKSNTVNFEIQTFIKVVAVLEKRKISYPAELARLLGIKRQTMTEIVRNMINPLAAAGVFEMAPGSLKFGEPRYYVWLSKNWEEAFVKWIKKQIENSKK